MSDDLGKKISQITELLGQETMPDNLKGLIGLLANSLGKQDTSSKSGDSSSVRDERSGKSDLDDNIEMVRKIKKVMDRLNSNNDPRINLLNAIKPFLNNKRQKKLNNCIRLLHVSSLARFMDDNDKGGLF